MPFLDKVVQALPNFKINTDTKTEGCGWVKKSMFCSNGEETYWYITTHTNQFAYKRINYDWLEEYSRVILDSPRIFVSWNNKQRIYNWLTLQDKGEPGNMMSSKARRGMEMQKLNN